MRLYVKYCGGCNPLYDRVRLVRQTAECLGAEPVYEQPETADFRLIVSGCSRSCAHVHGEGLQCTLIQEKTEPRLLADRIRLEQMEEPT